jgi:dynactin complex subunit
MSDDKEVVGLQIDVGVLKQQVSTLCTLCDKMDKVMEKLVDQHDRHIAKIYTDMDNRRLETETDIKELHVRIDTVLDKLHDSEYRLMNELKAMRNDMQDHNSKEKETLNKLLQWKWMVVGGVIVLSWLVSHINLETFSMIFGK